MHELLRSSMLFTKGIKKERKKMFKKCSEIHIRMYLCFSLETALVKNMQL